MTIILKKRTETIISAVQYDLSRFLGIISNVNSKLITKTLRITKRSIGVIDKISMKTDHIKNMKSKATLFEFLESRSFLSCSKSSLEIRFLKEIKIRGIDIPENEIMMV